MPAPAPVPAMPGAGAGLRQLSTAALEGLCLPLRHLFILGSKSVGWQLSVCLQGLTKDRVPCLAVACTAAPGELGTPGKNFTQVGACSANVLLTLAAQRKEGVLATASFGAF